METRVGLRARSSRRAVVYRRSAWRVHQFEVCAGGGEPVCRAAVLRMRGSLLLWLGGGGGAPALGDLAAGAPVAAGALATALTAGSSADAAAALARRLVAALGRPVFVCCGAEFDRLTLPLVERGLVAEIKSRPECF